MRLFNPARLGAGLAAAGLIMTLMMGCGGGDDDGGGEALTPVDKVARGWQRFEEADYTAALQLFREAFGENDTLSDAYNGAGWASGRISGGLEAAADFFATSLSLDITRYDALAGWAFAAYQLQQWQAAVDKVDSVLNSRAGWRFIHQTSVDFLDLRLVQAAAYYNLGDWNASLNVVVTYLNPTFEADVSTPAGRRELLEEIERLRRLYG